MPLKYAVPVNLEHFDNHMEWLTAASLRSVNIWLIDGINNDNFVMYEYFASVEFENNNNRSAYTSYPLGKMQI